MIFTFCKKSVLPLDELDVMFHDIVEFPNMGMPGNITFFFLELVCVKVSTTTRNPDLYSNPYPN